MIDPLVGAAPRDRLVTLPQVWPERSLGLLAAAWMIDNLVQPNGPRAGEAFRPTPGQVDFLVQFYGLDEGGGWLFHHGVRRLAKGSGKSPFVAAMCLFELLGPCRFGGWDDGSPFGVVGVRQSLPLVQVVATAEAQTFNTMRMVRAFCPPRGRLRREYGLFVGKTFLEVEDGGRLEQRASSFGTIEGGETSFTAADETEHWLPSRGGPELMATIKQNASKNGARVVETCNAWRPGDESAAERSFEDWVAQEEGRLRGEQRVLYDSVMAPADAVLVDGDAVPAGRVGLDEALRFVYADCPWALESLQAKKELIWSPSYSESRSVRYFFNRPSAAENAWVTAEEWVLLRDPGRVVEEGEEVVLFFDGSRSGDHTGLVGCCMRDGHVFVVGHWAPGADGVVDVAAVDSGVRRAFERFRVVAFWADVREWESFVRSTWPEELGEGLVLPAVRGSGVSASLVAWDMRSHAYQFAEAAETALTEIREKVFTHDGSAALGEHVANCRVNEYRGRFSVKKESPKSPRKIDLAVCMIGARMLYRAVKGSPEWAALHDEGDGWSVMFS